MFKLIGVCYITLLDIAWDISITSCLLRIQIMHAVHPGFYNDSRVIYYSRTLPRLWRVIPIHSFGAKVTAERKIYGNRTYQMKAQKYFLFVYAKILNKTVCITKWILFEYIIILCVYVVVFIPTLLLCEINFILLLSSNNVLNVPKGYIRT